HFTTPTPPTSPPFPYTTLFRSDPTPSAACIDSPSVKTTEMGGPERGYDGGKKINGRKRHLLVDTLGLLLAIIPALGASHLGGLRSEEHTSELQSRGHLVCRLLL